MIFTIEQKVLFKHCDPAGIVFYPRYFEMMNDCVEAFFDAIGAPFEVLHKTDAVPTAQIETTFHSPSRHGDLLTISLSVTRIGGASLNLLIEAHCADAPRFTTKSTLVYINLEGRSQRWPDPIRTALTPYLRSTA